jgi:hypothetical protein
VTQKYWYIAGLAAAASCAAACSSLDHVHNAETFETFWKPLAFLLLLACFWMLVAGFRWSRVGVRSAIVVSAILNAFIPILLTLFLYAFGLDPNIHGSYGLILLFELFSLITMIAMLLGTSIKSKKTNA